MKHIDQLREHFGQQQVIFDKELSDMRNQLTKVDNVRLQAQKELMYLQQKVKEQKLWDIVDQTPFLPIIEGDRVFKTTKFVNSNLTESEKRQLLLQEYYRNDKARHAIQQLYGNNDKFNQDERVPELYTETQLILPKIQTQPTKVFDESLLKDLQSMKMRDDEITKRLQAQDTTIIKDPSEYQRMLQNQTILPLLQNMKNQGQRSVVTPLENHQKPETGIKKLRSEGESAQITFLDQNYGTKFNTEQQFDLEFTEEQQRTEELILNESEIPVVHEQLLDFEEQDQQSIMEPPDPLDENIDKLLNNIHQIVNSQQQPQQQQQIGETQNTLQKTMKLVIQKDQIKQRERPEGFKPVNFAKSTSAKLEPVKYKIAPPVQTKQNYNQPEILPDENFERLDKLISKLT